MQEDPFWSGYLLNDPCPTVHLAVFNPPYLEYILDGRKTVESRFSVVRCAPFEQVVAGDVMLLKTAAGPITGLCVIDRVWFYSLEPDTWDEIRQTFTDMLCAHDPDFWKSRERARYASLMRVGRPTRLEPFDCAKRDRRGWVVMSDSTSQPELAL